MSNSSGNPNAPTLRLAYAKPDNAEPAQRLKSALSPTVRLACTDSGRFPNPPTVRLAYNEPILYPQYAGGCLGPPHVRLSIPEGGISGPGHAIVKGLTDPHKIPALLVSYVYLRGFLKHRRHYVFRDWVMDSGAFSAWQTGTEIKLGDYIRACREQRDRDPTLTEIYSLDVIGDWKASLKNAEHMWKAGIEAIPCYHIGEPWEVLLGLARDYPKIALGGVARHRGKVKQDWAKKCVSAVWPKKVHGFGYGDGDHILAVPFHSTDATNWEIGPCRFGRWAQFDGAALSIRGSRQNLRGEVARFLALEAKARSRWRKEMAELEGICVS